MGSQQSHGETHLARQRDQPGAAFLMERFVLGEDSAHLEKGCLASVSLHSLPPTGNSPGTEEAELPAWTDPWSGEERGGAQVFVPAACKNGGVGSAFVLFIHGGGFEYGAPLTEGYDNLCSRIADGSGLPVICPDHPLSGEGRDFKAKEIMDSLERCLRWLFRFDPVSGERRQGSVQALLAGDSAGGNQAMSLLLRVLSESSQELRRAIRGTVMISPWLDLTCGSHTYVSNAYAAEAHTGDVAFRKPADANRNEFRSMGLTYVGSEALLKDCTFSPYWLVRGLEPDLLHALEESKIPLWICMGASEALSGEVMDFAQRLKDKVPVEMWLHEAMFHDWVMYQVDQHPFPSRDAAFQNLFDFMKRVLAQAPVLKEGIHYYIEDW
eukprot:TRINITY_DN35597_c0_g1_i1.p1 TRINITY_DN35597_c0_g1~~TRINITY_DN35597_c0_g1_i1.p1  ORF type:complete len:382 (-),score=72.87 TRINITY_DN35597_c0_g1_i1:50-1195(-)